MTLLCFSLYSPTSPPGRLKDGLDIDEIEFILHSQAKDLIRSSMNIWVSIDPSLL